MQKYLLLDSMKTVLLIIDFFSYYFSLAGNMELKYIVLTIIKILISVPGVLLITNQTYGAALMGGHLDNKSQTNFTDSYNIDYDIYDEPEYINNNENLVRNFL